MFQHEIRKGEHRRERVVYFVGDAGGQFADGGAMGTMTGAALGGVVGGIIGGAMDQKSQKSAAKKQEGKVDSLSEKSPEELLQMDKHNFELLYGDIIKIMMKDSTFTLNGARAGVMVITGKKKEQFDIAPNQNFQECYKAVSVLLPDKFN